MATTIKLIETTVMVVPIEEFDNKALFTIYITNFDRADKDLGPRLYQDNKYLSVFEVLAQLEFIAREAYFENQTFNLVEKIYYGNDHYAVFSLKELRKTKDGIFEACYKYEHLTCE